MPTFTITIPDDQTDALAALQFEADRVAAATSAPFTIEDVIADAIVTKFNAEREGQLRQKAIDNALASDVDYQAYLAAKAPHDTPPVTEPPVRVPPQ